MAKSKPVQKPKAAPKVAAKDESQAVPQAPASADQAEIATAQETEVPKESSPDPTGEPGALDAELQKPALDGAAEASQQEAQVLSAEQADKAAAPPRFGPPFGFVDAEPSKSSGELDVQRGGGAADQPKVPAADEKRRYRVVSPLEHDRKLYAIGDTVSLSTDQAKPLLAHTVESLDE